MPHFSRLSTIKVTRRFSSVENQQIRTSFAKTLSRYLVVRDNDAYPELWLTYCSGSHAMVQQAQSRS